MKKFLSWLAVFLQATVSFSSVKSLPAGNNPNNINPYYHQEAPAHPYQNQGESSEQTSSNPVFQDLSSHPFFAPQASFGEVPSDPSFLSGFNYGLPSPNTFNPYFHHVPSQNKVESSNQYYLQGPQVPHYETHSNLESSSQHSSQNREQSVQHETQPNSITQTRRPFRLKQFAWQWDYSLEQLRELYGILHDAWGGSAMETLQRGYHDMNSEISKDPSLVHSILHDRNEEEIKRLAGLSKKSLTHKRRRVALMPCSKERYLNWIFDMNYKGPRNSHGYQNQGLSTTHAADRSGDPGNTSGVLDTHGQNQDIHHEHQQNQSQDHGGGSSEFQLPSPPDNFYVPSFDPYDPSCYGPRRGNH